MKQYKIEIKWGILFSIVALVWMIGEHSVGLHDVYISRQPVYTNLFGLAGLAIYALAIHEKKIHFYNGNMSWKQGFLSGVVVALTISVLSPVVQYVSYTLISPEFSANIIKYAVEHKVQTQAQAKFYFNLRNFTTQGIFSSLSMGVLASAIVAQFLKSKNV